MTAKYLGFSSKKWISSKGKTFGISGIESIKTDLINHIFTGIGERVMMPNFGTRIPLMAFEQNDAITRDIIEEDIKMVINYDPRVSLISLNVVSLPDLNLIAAFCEVFYNEFNEKEVFKIDIPVKG